MLVNAPDIIRGTKNNDFSEIKEAIKADPNCINQLDDLGRTPAMYAAMGGNLGLLNWLSEQEGFISNIIGKNEEDLLFCAMCSGNDEAVSLAFQLLHPVSIKSNEQNYSSNVVQFSALKPKF